MVPSGNGEVLAVCGMSLDPAQSKYWRPPIGSSAKNSHLNLLFSWLSQGHLSF